MATLKPFNGVRYNSANISKLICPPYDIISPKEKAALKKQSAHNLVRVELPDPAGELNKYRNAGLLFRQWMRQGVLLQDEKPAYYVYEQRFSDHGRKQVRRGFFGALKLEAPGKGSVKPHEKTLAKPKADRLRLMRSVKANISPIFGLFNDTNGAAGNLIARTVRTKPASAARDKEVQHLLWKVDDPAGIAVLEKAVRAQKIFIADGHHRYETAWNYAQERKKKDGNRAGAEYNYILMYLCPMEDKGLVIWPTHRVVEPPADIERRIGRYFKVLPKEAFYKQINRSPQPLLVWHRGAYRTLVVRDPADLKRVMADKCAPYRALGVSILHSLLLHDVPPENITYVKDEAGTISLARERGCMAVIVPSTPVAAVKAIALAGQTMPQKSTYFYPKVTTGMVIHQL